MNVARVSWIVFTFCFPQDPQTSCVIYWGLKEKTSCTLVITFLVTFSSLRSVRVGGRSSWFPSWLKSCMSGLTRVVSLTSPLGLLKWVLIYSLAEFSYCILNLALEQVVMFFEDVYWVIYAGIDRLTILLSFTALFEELQSLDIFLAELYK